MVADLLQGAVFSSINYTYQKSKFTEQQKTQDFAESSFLIISCVNWKQPTVSYWIRFFGRSGLCSESLQPQTDRQEKNG